MEATNSIPNFAVLQLSGCSGCEVSLLNAEEWVDKYNLLYMPLVITTKKIPDEMDTLIITGGVRNEEDEYNLRKAAAIAKRVVAVGTCAISGGVSNLGDRDEVRQLFNQDLKRHNLPTLLPKSHPVDKFIEVDLYLPGCPPTPELFMAALTRPEDFKAGIIVCAECGRKKLGDMKPKHLTGFQTNVDIPDICLVNQGFLCVGTSTRGGCRALCTIPGHPCVGCRGPSDILIEKESGAWFESIKRTFNRMTEIPEEELDAALKSPQLSLFLFQFADYEGADIKPRNKNKVL